MASRRDDNLQRALGARIRDVRRQRGLTLEQVAARIETPTSALGRIEGGGRGISMSTLFALARALECTAAELVTFEGEVGEVAREDEIAALWKLAPESMREPMLALLSAVAKA